MKINKKYIITLLALIIVNIFLINNRTGSNEGLDAFYSVISREPLMASSIMNVVEMEKTIKMAEAENIALSGRYGFKADILPVSFLRKFLESSKVYADFLEKPTMSAANRLVEAMEEANASYISDIESLSGKINEINRRSTSTKKYISIDRLSYFDADLVSRDMEKMKANSIEVSARITQLKKCLSGSLSDCHKENPGKVRPIDNDDKECFEKKSISRDTIGMPEGRYFSGPFKISSRCWSGKDHGYVYVGDNYRDYLGYCEAEFFLADYPYYAKTVDTDFGKKLKEAGVKTAIVNRTMPYLCNDSGYQAKVSNLVYFISSFKDDTAFDLMTNGKKINSDGKLISMMRETKEAEGIFFYKQCPSDSDLNNLIVYYQNIYAYLTDNDIDNEELAEKLLHRIRTAKERTGNFHLIMNSIIKHLANLRAGAEVSGINPQEDYVYMARNNYSLTYLSFSSAVWVSDDSPEYLKGISDIAVPSGKTEDEIMDYQKAKSAYGSDKLIEWQKKFYELDKTRFYQKEGLFRQ